MNSEQPLISVIVPVYNAEKYLPGCIECLTGQTYKNIEIILVDDGSPDSCPVICDEAAEKDDRIRVIHKINGGVSSARNLGLDNVHGEYIAFVDADDRIDADMYEAMLCEILENGADAASCGMVRESTNGYKEYWGSDELTVADTLQILRLVGEANGILPVSVVNKLYSKNTIGNIRFDMRFRHAEDTLFNFKVAGRMKKIVIHNLPRYHYINNEASVTHKDFNENKLDEHKVMDIILAEAPLDALPWCIKGDVMKSFRTIQRMCSSGILTERYGEIRKRIIKHFGFIMKSPLFGKVTKLQTLVLYFFPHIYKFLIGIRGRRKNREFAKLTGADNG